ncbi:MAG: PAS domain-containing protein [Labilibaculum sp.]|nr:PAS domain-containing protein [Labilibaculum sp.]MBI9058895.1 PAS domain-containing protein [Labilibaculum sp.]
MIKLEFIQNLSIKNKIVAIILSVTCLVIGIGFTLVSIWNINKLKSDTLSGLALNAKLVGSYCIVPLTFNDENQAKETLLSFKNINIIEIARLYDKSGNLFATYPDSLISNTNVAFKEQQNNVFLDDYFYVKERIFFKNEFYGTLHIKANSSHLSQATKNLIIPFSLLIFVLIIFSYLLALQLQKYISEPILSLKNHFDKIAENQDFTTYIDKQSKDEIGRLYDGFNNLLSQISIKQGERDKAQVLQKESEENFRGIYEQSPIAIEIYDKDGKLVDVNSQTLKMFGLNDVKYILGYDFWTDANLTKENIKNLKDGQPIFVSAKFDFDLANELKLFPTSRKGLMHVDIYAIPLVRENLINGFLVQMIDVTERKKSEEAIKRISERLQFATEGANVGTWHWNTISGELIWSSACKALFDIPEDEVMSYERFSKALHPDDRDRTDQAANFALENHTDFNTEYRSVWRDGSIHWLEAAGRGYYDDTGKNIRMEGIIIDIDEKKRAEQELIHSQEKLNLALEGGEIGVWEWDFATDLTIWDSKMERMFGLDEGEFNQTYERFKACLHPDDIASAEFAMKNAIEGIAPYDTVYRVIWKNKEVKFIRAKALVVKDKEDKPISMVGICIDVSNIKNAELEIKSLNENLELRIKDRTAQLEATNKELNAFSYSVSHDLRAPLRGINGFTQILMEDYSDKMDDEFKRISTIIWENSNKMGKLIDDLLAFSRLNRSDVQKSIIDMKKMVYSMFFEITNEESRERIDLEIGELCNTYGDPAMLKQVWTNLLSNAIKFSSKRDKTMISITCKKEKEKYVYCIKDNGAGFDMKYTDKLFGVFQRLHSLKEFEGTGVGLAIVQRIILRHGGEVWAKGEEDKGAEFYFSLHANDQLN